MVSTTEQGHDCNVTNFDLLIINCTSFGTAFNPSKETLKIEAIQALSENAKTNMTNVRNLAVAYKNAVSARVAAFKPFDKLITRVSNALKASDTTVEIDNMVRTIVRKIQGRRATPKKTEEQKKSAAEAGKEIVEISTSQMSYDSRIENFNTLIILLASVPMYMPNEEELKITALTDTYNDLKSKNMAVVSAEITLNNARIARNTVMYQDNIGLVDIATDIKTYIKSLFGTQSPQYKLVSGIRFTKYNI